MSAASKRIWRERHPVRRRESERVRAQARRDGYWNLHEYYVALQAWISSGRQGEMPQRRVCASAESNQRYELSMKRLRTKLRRQYAGKPEIMALIDRIPDGPRDAPTLDDLKPLDDFLRRLTEEMGFPEFFDALDLRR